MKKYFIGFLISLNISSVAIAQEGKNFGFQIGVGTGGLGGFSGYTSGILTSGGIFKQWIKTNKKTYKPGYGLEVQLDVSYTTVDNNSIAPYNSFNVTVFTLPLLFKVNLGSNYADIPQKDEEGKNKTVTIYRGIYLFAGPQAGYVSTNATGQGTLSPFFGGVMAGIQIWLSHFKIEVSGNRSFTEIYKGKSDKYVFNGMLSIGVAL